VCEASVAVADRDPAIDSLIELDFCASETESAVLGRKLQAAALPLHDVVVADDAFVQERADAVELAGSGPLGLGGVARRARKAAVVVGEVLRWQRQDHQRWRGGVRCTSDPGALLRGAESLNAVFGPRRLRGDEGDAELRESAGELGWAGVGQGVLLRATSGDRS
jgi:hypothetical protein